MATSVNSGAAEEKKKMKECGPFFKTPRIFSDPFFRLCLLTF